MGYRSDSTRPSGSVNLRSQAVGIRVQSSSLDWLVVDGTRFESQGSATVNGVAGYAFSLSGSSASGSASQDTLRLRVVDSNQRVVYDNERFAAPFDYLGTLPPGMLFERHAAKALFRPEVSGHVMGPKPLENPFLERQGHLADRQPVGLLKVIEGTAAEPDQPA